MFKYGIRINSNFQLDTDKYHQLILLFYNQIHFPYSQNSFLKNSSKTSHYKITIFNETIYENILFIASVNEHSLLANNTIVFPIFNI